MKLEKTLLIYDGDCGICNEGVRCAQKIDRDQKFKIKPFQNFSSEELASWNLNAEKCVHEMKVMSITGKVYGGAFGLNYFLWQFWPWKIFVFFIYVIPILLLLEILGYKLFAKNRHLISKWMGLKSCELSARLPPEEKK